MEGSFSDQDQYPSYQNLEISTGHECMTFIFLFNGKRFHLEIYEKHLQGDGSHLEDFKTFENELDTPHVFEQFEDWALEALSTCLEKLAPIYTPDPSTRRTLLQYYTPPTFYFQLINKNGVLSPVQENFDPEVHHDPAPRTWIFNSIPSPEKSRGISFILQSEMPQAPTFLASQIQYTTQDSNDVSSIPRKVYIPGSDTASFFKPAIRDRGCRKELKTLLKLQDSGLFNRRNSNLRVSQINGLVLWDSSHCNNGGCLMGFLLEYIPGKTLRDRLRDSPPESLRRRWFNQIKATIECLHKIGAEWGDVKPDNIMINAGEDAVVIDFGGGYTPEYIPHELRDTQQGDLMALERIKEETGV